MHACNPSMGVISASKGMLANDGWHWCQLLTSVHTNIHTCTYAPACTHTCTNTHIHMSHTHMPHTIFFRVTVVAQIFNSSTLLDKRKREVCQHKFKTSLVYKVSFRSVKVTKWDSALKKKIQKILCVVFECDSWPPVSLSCLNSWSPAGCLGRIMRNDFVGECVSHGWERLRFQSLWPSPVHLVHPACGLRCELWAVPTPRPSLHPQVSHPLEMPIQWNTFFFKFLQSWCFIKAIEK